MTSISLAERDHHVAEWLAATEPPPLVFGYTNHRGEFGTRRVIPQRLYFGATAWHPEPQWLLEAQDLDKDAVRVFAFKDMASFSAAGGA